MDKLVNEFTVNRPINETWEVLNDVELIAPCMPGAELKEIEGEIFRGVVKVKLGAIATAFKGQAKFVEQDVTNHRVVLHGEGRDTSGKGSADAIVTATLESVTPSATKVGIVTDLRITGKVAQFGRGIMGDVSKKLIAQFATNLNTMLEAKGAGDATATNGSGSAKSADNGSPAATAAAVAAASAPASEKTVSAAASGAKGATAAAVTAAPQAADETVSTGTAPQVDDTPVDAPAGAGAAPAGASGGAIAAARAARPAVRKIEGPASEPIELSGLAGGAILKRLLPVFAGLVVVFVVLRRLRRR